MYIKKCSKCLKPFPATAEYFYKHSCTKDGLTHLCKKCKNQQKQEARIKRTREKHEFIKQQKIKKPCSICEEYFPSASLLDFHHNEPTEKDNTISQMRDSSYQTLKKEINKCSVICVFCHRRATEGQNVAQNIIRKEVHSMKNSKTSVMDSDSFWKGFWESFFQSFLKTLDPILTDDQKSLSRIYLKETIDKIFRFPPG